MGPVTRTASKSDNSGFTLIEVMVSIIILMVGMLGLLEALGTASHNVVKNGLRSEAVNLAESRMVEMKMMRFDRITSQPFMSISSKIRGGQSKYGVKISSKTISDVSKQLTIRVAWRYKNMTSFHEVRTIRTYDPQKDQQ